MHGTKIGSREITCPPSPEKVSNFINADSVTWNIVALEKFFIPMDAECICKIQLSR
jgi:hypothetical protein